MELTRSTIFQFNQCIYISVVQSSCHTKPSKMIDMSAYFQLLPCTFRRATSNVLCCHGVCLTYKCDYAVTIFSLTSLLNATQDLNVWPRADKLTGSPHIIPVNYSSAFLERLVRNTQTKQTKRVLDGELVMQSR